MNKRHEYSLKLTIKYTQMNLAVDFFFNKEQKWQQEFRKLRTIILDCQLTEELKWGNPCYTFQASSKDTAGERNIVLIHGFKEYCALLFFKGALLKDTAGILVQQTKNVQAARQVRFSSFQEIIAKEASLKAYIYEAIEIEKAGLKVNFKKTADFEIPPQFQQKLDAIPALKNAFEALTPERQRAYIFHFSQPKQVKTRESRVEKWIPQILMGKGLND